MKSMEPHSDPAQTTPRAEQRDDAAPIEPDEPPPPPKPTLRMVKKHLLATRWMHWINFPVLSIMVWSGLLIYWADYDREHKLAHAIYSPRIGDHVLIRLSPDWFWTWYHAPFQLTTGLGWHFFFMWLFMINGVLYVLYTALSGEWRELVPDRNSFREAVQVTLHDLHLRKDAPPQGKYNGAQKIAYTGIVLMGFGSLVTGLAMYKPTSVHWLTTILGGYEVARFFHFWLTMGFVGFFVVHVVQVALAGWNNFRSMVSGYELAPIESESETHA
jgi:thiosulfate reductase cytochrome b subunit